MNTNIAKANFDKYNTQAMGNDIFRFIGWKYSPLETLNFNSPRGKGYVDFLLLNIKNGSLLNDDEIKSLHCGIIIDFSSVTFGMYKELSKEEMSNLSNIKYNEIIMNYLVNAIAEARPYVEIKKDYSAITIDFLKRKVSIYALLNTLYR